MCLSSYNSILGTLFICANIFHNSQAQTYDPEGEYVAYWLPQLQELPKEKRNFPGKLYMEQIVPLKFGNPNGHRGQDRASAARKTNYGGQGRKTKGY